MFVADLSTVWYRLGFVSYLHSLYLDSFQTTKRHSYEGYSIYIAILSSFLLGVYPVDVTDLQPYYTPTICHNSMNNHWIPTKLGTANSCNTLFECAKFQLNWSTHLYFMVDSVYLYVCLHTCCGENDAYCNFFICFTFHELLCTTV